MKLRNLTVWAGATAVSAVSAYTAGALIPSTGPALAVAFGVTAAVVTIATALTK